MEIILFIFLPFCGILVPILSQDIAASARG